MKLTCANCQQQVNIDDAKIPTGVFKVKCPKCGKMITASRDVDAVVEDAGEDLSPAAREAIKNEVIAAKREILGAIQALLGDHSDRWTDQSDDEDEGPGSKHALICEDEQAFVDTITHSLRRLGYHCDIARTTAEAIKKLDSRSYDLVTVDHVFPDDKEGGQKILSKINGAKPFVRRQMFAVLVSATVKSADASAAFFHGANIVVNKDEIKNLEALIREGQKRFQEIYRVFNQLMVEKFERL